MSEFGAAQLPSCWSLGAAHLLAPVAACRGVKKYGGKVLLKAHVDQVTFDGKRATGVRLKNGSMIRARKNVVSNASMWDTLPLLPSHMVPANMRRQADTTPQNRSFMHLHLGFDATGVPCRHCFHCCCPLRLRLDLCDR